MSAFEVLGLDKPLLDAIQDMGFESPSEVQEKAIPLLLPWHRQVRAKRPPSVFP